MKGENLILLIVFCTASLVDCQDACERIIVDDLGRSDMLENTGLVASALTPTGEGGILVNVRITNMSIVCEAQHRTQDRYRYTSVVVSFNCFTTDIRVPECNDSSVVLTEQFDFGCVSGAWSRNILSDSNAARSANPNATLSTGLDTGCILCINPSNSEAARLVSPVDSVTHCVDCANCPTGLQRCYNSAGTTTEVCCNYFHQGACVIECPSPLVPSTNLECVTGCPELSNPNGSFNYTDSQFVGSLATLTCDANYEVTGPNPVTCQANGEWTGTPTCEDTEVTECPELSDANGNFGFTNNQLVGSVANLTCNANFKVGGSNPVTCQANGEWTGMPICETEGVCGPGCIAGSVVGSILGFLLLLLIAGLITAAIVYYVKKKKGKKEQSLKPI